MTELEAMTRISEALEGLEPEERKRVLSWVAARYTVRNRRNATNGKKN